MCTRGEDIAIIGSGCRFPGGSTTPSKFWAALSDPELFATKVPALKGYYHKDAKYHGHANVQEAYLLEGEGVHRQFDAAFFGISPPEANLLDPQIRILLEVVYEALESGGQTIHQLRGSDTAVYAGQMVNDYELQMHQDYENFGKYHATGTSRAMLSNRLSYFFDWHGPSLTIDTACSSSLVALHHAVQHLRSGGSGVAIVAGSNLIFNAGTFIAESNLQMLSPDGRSRMWDADANGYARGEGVAALVLKTRAAAEADGDHIECIIRETALNQDGRTRGPTMPSAIAQAQLIRDCYARAGLDLRNPAHRPQYFEAHGTGTPAGDPIEAEAISTALFPEGYDVDGFGTLLVGSCKTVIGHTEGTAGIAGILKASLAIQNSMIPPNLLFNRLNPDVRPFYNNLCIPTGAARPWPAMPWEGPHRVSVNGFGFGGTNAHVIVESYTPPTKFPQPNHPNLPSLIPFVFSAASELSLQRILENFIGYLRRDGAVHNLRDISYSLDVRRTRFPVAVAVAASTLDELVDNIERMLVSARTEPERRIGVRATRQDSGPVLNTGNSQILGVFTGQGAQWAQMGLDLITNIPAATELMEKLQDALDGLPVEDRPTWSLLQELHKDASSTRIMSATLSQPLCTAIQIAQVDLIRATGLDFTAVVGHSSGEIAAAYAAGLISAQDAVCIAHYRGLHSGLSQGPQGQRGAMMVVGTSAEDAQELLHFDEFQGRVCLAAVNSSHSVTLSGDQDAIEELALIFEDEEKFARILKVDKAYHSHHMNACSGKYLDSLNKLGIQLGAGNEVRWFSSVFVSEMDKGDRALAGPYWDHNMVKPVLFTQSVDQACLSMKHVDLIIEIGPHPVLKGPTLDTIHDRFSMAVPYTGLLRRGTSGIRSFADGLGLAWTHLGHGAVNLQSFGQFVSSTSIVAPKLVKELPFYAWDHGSEYWHESRYARAGRLRSDTVHELLGHLTPDSTENESRWRHILRPSEIPWLAGHRLQNAVVFPAAGYIVTVLEAAMAITKDTPINLIELFDIEIVSALMFENDNTSMEMILSLTNISRHTKGMLQAEFKYHAAPAEGINKLSLKASGHMRIYLGDPNEDGLPPRIARVSNLRSIGKDKFYESMAEIGYQYSGPFKSLRGMERKLGAATGLISKLESSSLLIHPAVLDAAFHSTFVAYASPGDRSLDSMYIPRRIQRLTINPELCTQQRDKEDALEFDTVHSNALPHINLVCDISIYTRRLNRGMVQIEGLECVPLSPSTATDDKAPFCHLVWGVAEPDVQLALGSDASCEVTTIKHLAQTVKQIVHRYPHMRILELVSKREETATEILINEICSKFMSYTVAMPPAASNLADVKSIGLKQLEIEGKVIFKDFDPSKSLKDQGFVSASYDLVLAPHSLHMQPGLDIEQVLDNIRRLLKSGGYLVMRDTGLTSVTLAEPTGLPVWADLLRRTGFSAINAQRSSNEGDVMRSPVFASQAVDDKVSFLRNPLSATLTSGRLVHGLVILSGKGAKLTALARRVSTSLGSFCSKVHISDSYAGFLSLSIEPSTVVLSIADLDESVFRDLTEERWATLKKLALHPGTLIWVTQGRRSQDPYANMVLGLLRGAARDNPALDYLLLDFEDAGNMDRATIIAESLLRHKAISQWRHPDSLQLTVENELVVDEAGRLLIPRLMVSQEMSDRYNSNGRELRSWIQPGMRNIDVSTHESKWDLSLHPSLPRPDQESACGITNLETTHSILSPVRITEFGCMFVILGKDAVSGDRFVALSSKNNSVVAATTRLSMPVETDAVFDARLLWLIAHFLCANIALRGLSKDDRVLIHEPSKEFARAIAEQTTLSGVKAMFMTTRPEASQLDSSRWTVIHPKASDSTLERLAWDEVSVFIDLASESAKAGSIGQRICTALPFHCRKENLDSLLGKTAMNPRESCEEGVQFRFEKAVSWATAIVAESGETDWMQAHVPTIALGSVPGHDHCLDPLTTIEWKSTSATLVKACPVDSLVSFRANRTYWLVGLTGGLGISLCEWMTQRGARNFVISSRNPDVEVTWLDEMCAKGITVKVSRCDVTRKEQIKALYHEMSTSMPPIAGIAQGVMVLEDTALPNMTLEQLLAVTKPKTEGSAHINDLFLENTLDFFVFFSSVSTVVGNHGQANYASANSFMISLAEQRRRQGLAASVIDIGPVGGVGYINQTFGDAGLTNITMKTSGFVSTSERDFHQLFAEAVLAGRPGSTGPIELVSGLRSVTHHDEHQPVWYKWPRMSHLIQNHGAVVDSASSVSDAGVPIKIRLGKAPDNEVHDIIWTSFASQLGSYFQIDDRDTSRAELSLMRFDQMGIDSLIAVEIRGWFAKTLEVNIPVLKILNGGSVGDLVTTAAKIIISRRVPGAEGLDYGEASDTSQDSLGNGSSTKNSPSCSGEDEFESQPSSVPDFNSNVDSDRIVLRSLPVSSTQSRFYPSGLFLEDRVGLNHTVWAKFSGSIDPERLRKAVRAVGQQHEILRTAFSNQGSKQMQHILEHGLLGLEHMQIQSEEEVTKLATSIQKTHVYDVALGETMKILLLSLSAEEQYIVMGVHPLIMDATGIQVFLRWLAFHYTHPDSQRRVKQFSTASEQRHADDAAGKLEASVRYWRQEFSHPPPPLPLLTISKVNERPALKAYENITASCRIGKETKVEIGKVCRRLRVTPFHFYLAVLRALLLRYTVGGEDVTIAVAENGRGQDAEEMDVIGPLFNLVLVRLVANRSTEFEVLLEATRDKTYAGLAHADLPFPKLVEEFSLQRDAKYTPFFQVLADYRTGQRETVAFGEDNHLHLMGFDLNVPYDVYLDTIDEPDNDCAHCLFLRKDLFAQPEAEKLAASFKLLIEAFAVEPRLSVDAVDLSQAGEQ